MSEAQLQAAVEELARLLGWLVYHTYDSRRSAPGFPDLVMARAGRVIFAELKSERGRMTGDQEAWWDALMEVAGRAGYETMACYVFRPSDWLSGEIDEVLRG